MFHGKCSILFIHKERGDQHKLFIGIDTDPLFDVSQYDAEWRDLTPTFNVRGYNFRVRSKGKSYKGHITTRGVLVVRTYK